MTDFVVDAANATAALGHGRSEAEVTAEHARRQEPRSTDPKVAELLRSLIAQTGDAAKAAEQHAGTGADAAEKLVDADRESASVVGSSPSGLPPASSSRVAPSAPTNIAANPMQQHAMAQQIIAQQQQSLAQQQSMAQQHAQQQMAAHHAAAVHAQQMMSFAAQQQMAASATPIAAHSALPAGTILVDPNDLANIINSATGSNSEIPAGSSWNGSTTPDPIDLEEVEYNKMYGKLSDEEVSAAIDSAMDKTGIVEPDARAKWKVVLEYMADSEASDNASAVNNYDSNAVGATQVDGSPAQASRGIVQTIPTTFAAYHAAGTSNNIYDPEASFGAGINYMKDRYNIGTDGSGLDEFYAARSRGNYVGY